ncbi:UvrD-helicase domain-containing protein [Methanorbis rubei]|uniref:UvrD-helicase domain-containing protein n=1 Tax=Methanorbis rubei TaxID=3028300 RepID=UPI0030B8884D
MSAERERLTKEIRQDVIYHEMHTSTADFYSQLDILKKNFIAHQDVLNLQNRFQNVCSYFDHLPKWYSFEKNEKTFLDTYSHLQSYVDDWNQEFIKKELDATKIFFDDIDGKSLDIQQRTVAVTDEDNILVIAGAGTGKTLTICGKVRYLIEKKQINPNEILLISYTNKATEELRNRVSRGMDVSIDAKTFHKLGLSLITTSKGYQPRVAEEYLLKSCIQQYFKSLGENPSQIATIMTYFGSYLNIPTEFKDCQNMSDVTAVCQNLQLETLRSKAESYIDKVQQEDRITHAFEKVKSFEELVIANYLFLHGIRYEYERPYPFSTDDPLKKTYQPDFYLPDYDLYLEHFGISADGSVPWLSPEKEREYKLGIDWKREIHKKHGTILLETYSYYQKDGILLEKLEELLCSHDIIFQTCDLTKMYTAWLEHKYMHGYFDFLNLIAEFITLYKSNGYTNNPSSTFRKDLSSNPYLRERERLFLDIVSPIFTRYQDQLKTDNLIDFADMINQAAAAVTSGHLTLPYRYIIVDEFQDISVGRFRLIQAIRDKTQAKVVCVGDDWQSIYRFAGSDIGLFTNFAKYFGYTATLKIEKTYRNSQELVNSAGKFVMTNPEQLKKDLRSASHHVHPIRIVSYQKSPAEALKDIVKDIVTKFGEEATIMVLGRTNSDIERDGLCIFGTGFSLKKIRTSDHNQVFVVSEKYPKLVVEFLTAHRSKGLEADNVIILNLENNILGFPNKIADDPILRLVLTQKDGYLYGEERRLFYVALTRTRNNVYLPVPEQNSKVSIFVNELLKQDTDNIIFCPKTTFSAEQQVFCPKCGSLMSLRHGKFGEFYGCSRYPECHGTRSKNTSQKK